MPWPFSNKIKCSKCKHEIRPLTTEDLMNCPWCNKVLPTGYEDDIRDEMEKNANHVPYPRIAVGRAICYASEIYALSTHNKRIDSAGIEKKLEKSFGAGAQAESMKLMETTGRSYNDAYDKRAGLVIYEISGKNKSVSPTKPQPWTMLYVVFRGSRGELPGSKDNKWGAGWGEGKDGELQNVDWRANFDNQQTYVPWAEPVIKVHQGFKAIYMSVRQKIHQRVSEAMGKNPFTNVVVCGHSLGAGLTTLCAHDLESSRICNPFCFAFCSPRVGNLAFVRDFNQKLSYDHGILWGELDGRQYRRGFVFIQANDPVSGGQKHGFKKKMTKKEASEVADSGSILTQGKWAAFKKESATCIYYHIQNKIRASWFGLHDFKAMEKALLE